jgi:acyl-CoA carboxylase subunit beta
MMKINTTIKTIEHASGNQQGAQELFVKCTRCRALLYVRDWERNLKTCLDCGYHFRLSAAERIVSLLDEGSFAESDAQMKPVDPLNFRSQSHAYTEKLVEEQRRTGLNEAVITGSGRIEGHPLVLAVMDFLFIGGSMGLVVGEKVTRAIELAREQRIPLLIVSASGGARMHEGILSLMQMAKTSVALAHLSEARIPFISLLTDPTTGGVMASFAMLGDVILAEPAALVGFAGPRVIEQFMHRKLPKDTNTSEFMLEHGMIDAVVPRPLLRAKIVSLLDLYSVPSRQTDPCLRDSKQAQPLEIEPEQYQDKQCSLNPWERVQLARHKDRPQAADYIHLMCKSFFEFRGDRRYAEDPAIIGGMAAFEGRTVMLIGNQKGRDIEQKQECNFGMPHPEGYRKAQRLMRQAEKFGFPVVCLIDTPGAYPGLAAEQRGQAQAIAESLAVMATLRVPIVAALIGEGGSGGALALGLADRVLMLEHSIYTVASPEAAASILWRDNKLAAQAAEAMRITAPDLLTLEVIDGIVPEPSGGAHLDHSSSAQFLAKHLQATLQELAMIPIDDLLARRQTKFRNHGHCFLA